VCVFAELWLSDSKTVLLKDRPHFEKMLRTTAQHMSDAEINMLLADVLKK
jgi:hypothetical protein